MKDEDLIEVRRHGRSLQKDVRTPGLAALDAEDAADDRCRRGTLEPCPNVESPGDPPGGHGTIVVVEDDHNIADLIDLYLRNAGFRVLLAGDATRGLALVAQEHPVLVILDIGLPGPIDGLEACREIRRTSDVPVVVVTARGDEVDRILGLELGADDYVTKPFSPRELVARVRAILRRGIHGQPRRR